MNRFDEYYDIRLARLEDIPLIMDFIGNYWRKSHILATNRSFFEYEMVNGEDVNFIIAVSKESGHIEGIQGFIPASKDKDKLDVWAVLWKVLEDARPMLGMELKKRLSEITGARHELGVGANPKTAVPILKFFGYRIYKMNHYYMLSNREVFKIAAIDHNVQCEHKKSQILVERAYSFEEVERKFDFTILEKDIPYKDAWYINHRYFQHPIYQYQVFMIQREKNCEALLVMREQECCGERVLRIVDFLGKKNSFALLGNFFDSILPQYEYIDFYFSGFDESYVKDAGFVKREDQDSNIIPDYFNPFERKNVDIWADSNTDSSVFFKADGDQDRPS